MRELKKHDHPLFRFHDVWMVSLDEIASVAATDSSTIMIVRLKSGHEVRLYADDEIRRSLLDAWESWSNRFYTEGA